MIVVDASVVVKWYVQEPLSDEAEEILEPRGVLIAPDHVLAEVGQTLLRHLRGRTMTKNACQEALASLKQVVHLVASRNIADEAFAIAAEASCSLYDALYVAAAERWDATLVTADRRLALQLAGTRWLPRLRLLAPSPSKRPG